MQCWCCNSWVCSSFVIPICHHWFNPLMQVPPTGKGSLYIRPLLMGSGAILGLAPAPEYTFLIFVSPVGNYFKVGWSTPVICFLRHKNPIFYHQNVLVHYGGSIASGVAYLFSCFMWFFVVFLYDIIIPHQNIYFWQDSSLIND